MKHPMPLAPLLLTLLLLPLPGLAQTPAFTVGVEGGAVWQSRNDARIPNTGASSRFSLRDFQGSGPFGYYRLEGAWEFRDGHQLRALVAPFEITRNAVSQRALDFDEKQFAAVTDTEAHYRFDSYRLTYRYRFHEDDKWTWWGGVTLKVRDANVRLLQGALLGEDPDIGVVPLLNALGQYRLNEHWTLVLDTDGLWAPQGRAFDVALKARYALTERLQLGLGYRTLEGGADNDEVYTFAWQHYALAELQWRF
jgi:hypothetical protein